MNIFSAAVDRFGFFLLVCCVALAPIPFGSNSDGVAGLIGVTLALALFGTFLAPEPSRRVRRLHNAALAVAVIVALWSAVQVASLDGMPWSSPIWRQSRDLIGVPRDAIAVARYQPLYSMGYVLLPLAAFLSALIYVRDSARYTTFLKVVITAALAITVVCLAQYRYAPDTLLWGEKHHYVGSFTASFVNPNTAATYLGVVMLMALSAGLSHLERAGGIGALLRPRWRPADSPRWGAPTAYLMSALVLFVALVLTQSRAGIMASLAGTALLIAAFAYIAMRQRSSFLAGLGFGVLALAGAALLAQFYIGRLLLRLQLEGFVDPARSCTYKSTWRAIRDHFWQGTGLGTFQDVFPRYRLLRCGLEGHWNMAHNLFLEGMLSLGVGVFALCAAIVYGGLIHAYATGVRRRRVMRFVPLSCLGILAVLTAHSLVDFSMQIPGLAVVVGAILGAGAAISLEGASESRRASTSAMAGGRTHAWAESH
jgi:O-antigen ligase/polysaccharide polymerase Wzy-like membrane protein